MLVIWWIFHHPVMVAATKTIFPVWMFNQSTTPVVQPTPVLSAVSSSSIPVSYVNTWDSTSSIDRSVVQSVPRRSLSPATWLNISVSTLTRGHLSVSSVTVSSVSQVIWTTTSGRLTISQMTRRLNSSREQLPEMVDNTVISDLNIFTI